MLTHLLFISLYKKRFSRMDLNKDGKVDFAEFVHYMYRLPQRAGRPGSLFSIPNLIRISDFVRLKQSVLLGEVKDEATAPENMAPLERWGTKFMQRAARKKGLKERDKYKSKEYILSFIIICSCYDYLLSFTFYGHRPIHYFNYNFILLVICNPLSESTDKAHILTKEERKMLKVINFPYFLHLILSFHRYLF